MGCRLLLLPFAIVVLGPFTSLGILRTEAADGAEVGSSVNLPLRSGDKARDSEKERQLHADASQGASSLVECNAETSGTTNPKSVTIDEKTLQAKFKCAGEFTGGIVPTCVSSTTKCCKDAACASGTGEVEISEQLGVKGKAKNDNNTVTVTLEKILDEKRGQKIFYKCKKGEEEKTCVVAVALPGKLKDNECAIDRTIPVRVSEAKTSVDFKCSGKLNETPFEANDAQACTSGLKEATTALELDATAKDQGVYKLAIDQLPSAETKICYKCTYENVPTVEDTAKTTGSRLCSVMVTIAGKVPDDTNKTSTSTTSTESAASSVACRVLTFVTLGLVALMGVS